VGSSGSNEFEEFESVDEEAEPVVAGIECASVDIMWTIEYRVVVLAPWKRQFSDGAWRRVTSWSWQLEAW
jgi:hypothetical protein